MEYTDGRLDPDEGIRQGRRCPTGENESQHCRTRPCNASILFASKHGTLVAAIEDDHEGSRTMTRIRRILHPSDFSRASGAAFRKAVDLAKTNKAELLVVHVLVPTLPMLGDGYVSPNVYEDLVAAARGHGKKNLDALVAKAKKAGVRATSVLLEGVAHAQIARTARKQRTDLVVMGTHGRSGLAKLFLGSVAGRVVALASCPVMTVRGK